LSTYGIQLQLPIQQQLQPVSHIANQKSVAQNASPLPMQQQLPVASVISHLPDLQNGFRRSTEHHFTESLLEHQRPDVSAEMMHHNQIPGEIITSLQSHYGYLFGLDKL